MKKGRGIVPSQAPPIPPREPNDALRQQLVSTFAGLFDLADC